MRILNVLRMGAAALGALASMSITPTSAADIYGGGGYKDAPVYVVAPLWEGFYIGGHIGAAWRNNNNDDNRFFNNFIIPGPIVGTPAAFVIRDRDNNRTDAFGGVQIGYNWQNLGLFGSNFVLGVEADIGGFGGGNNRTFIAGAPGALTPVAIIRGNDNGGNFYGDITGRLGYAWGNALLYAKGGFAWLDRNNGNLTETVIGPGGTFTVFRDTNNNNNGTATGWTLGGGIEYALNTNWTVKVEYLHFDFNNSDRNCCFDGFNNNLRFRENLEFDTVKLGVNYIFHPAVAALPYK